MKEIKLFLAGDSTMSNYEEDVAPRAGWGQVIDHFFTEEVTVVNAASSGRSSKSFIDENRLEAIAREIGKEDYLFIQFGHNDQKTDEERRTEPYSTYQNYLKQYIDTAREKQAIPVLITPVQRRSFDEEGCFYDTHGEYPIAMKQLAEQLRVPLLDLGEMSKNLFVQLGSEEAKKLFLWFSPGQEVNYPDGEKDDTHFSEYGARLIAQIIIKEIKTKNLTLSHFIKENLG